MNIRIMVTPRLVLYIDRDYKLQCSLQCVPYANDMVDRKKHS